MTSISVLIQQFHGHPPGSSQKKQSLCTPLHVASANGHLIISELLIQYGAHVDTRDHNQDTPLHLASDHGQLEIVYLLLTSGSNVNSQGRGDSTPLHRASH